MTHSDNNNSDWAERKASLTEAFQAIEDALIEAGYDDTLVETQRGTFHWITVERARQAANARRAVQPKHELSTGILTILR
jgi:hypothetical protein